MLQQTQVDRVIPKYRAFLKRFPTLSALAKATVAEVLREWQGLGYNRRALFLKRAAEAVHVRGNFPKLACELEELPGIGPYTARAIATFAYGTREVFIETNIRSAFIHHFFPKIKKVDDTLLMPLIALALPKKNSAEWYHALMDYGSYLKRNGVNPSRRSRQYVQQSRFEGSVRQLRGAVIRAVAERALSAKDMQNILKRDPKIVLDTLVSEGFLYFHKGKYSLSH